MPLIKPLGGMIMSEIPIIGKSKEGVILTPEKLKKQQLSMQINRLCTEAGYMLIPVVQIIGSQMNTTVELAKVVNEAQEVPEKKEPGIIEGNGD